MNCQTANFLEPVAGEPAIGPVTQHEVRITAGRMPHFYEGDPWVAAIVEAVTQHVQQEYDQHYWYLNVDARIGQGPQFLGSREILKYQDPPGGTTSGFRDKGHLYLRAVKKEDNVNVAKDIL